MKKSQNDDFNEKNEYFAYLLYIIVLHFSFI